MQVTFGNPIEYKKHESKSIPLTTEDGEQVILDAKNCFSWGFQDDKFGGTQLSLVLDHAQEEFLSELRSVRDTCVKHLNESGHTVGERNIFRSLFEKEGKDPTLYAKTTKDILVRTEDKREISTKEQGDRCRVHASVVVESIFISKTTISLQVRVCEVMILKKVKDVKRPRKPRF